MLFIKLVRKPATHHSGTSYPIVVLEENRLQAARLDSGLRRNDGIVVYAQYLFPTAADHFPSGCREE